MCLTADDLITYLKLGRLFMGAVRQHQTLVASFRFSSGSVREQTSSRIHPPPNRGPPAFTKTLSSHKEEEKKKHAQKPRARAQSKLSELIPLIDIRGNFSLFDLAAIIYIVGSTEPKVPRTAITKSSITSTTTSVRT